MKSPNISHLNPRISMSSIHQSFQPGSLSLRLNPQHRASLNKSKSPSMHLSQLINLLQRRRGNLPVKPAPKRIHWWSEAWPLHRGWVWGGLRLLFQGEVWYHAWDPAHPTQVVVLRPNIDMLTATHQHHLKLWKYQQQEQSKEPGQDEWYKRCTN